MDMDTKAKIQIMLDYQRTRLHLYKQCCCYDLIYDQTCKLQHHNCPFMFVNSSSITDCYTYSRLAVVK